MAEETIDVLAEINRNIERIADHVQLEYELRIKAHRTAPESPGILRNPKLHRALVLVREILDEDQPARETRDTILRDRLFEVEALLSAELGEPVWEGHPDDDELDAAQLRGERRRGA